MVRLILFLAFVAATATGLSWLADRPGNLVINWEGFEIETSVFRAVVLLAAVMGAALFVWSLLRQLWTSPAVVGQFMARRRQQRGLEALSSGMIAIGAGDRGSATRYAILARKALPNEPLTHLLRAQAAQLSGDGATSRRIFEAMLAAPDTEQLGLRGLFLEAQREGETVAARQFAERAIRLNPKLVWAVEQLFELQCRDKDWPGALETMAIARKHGHVEKASADRRRAVLLTAQAIEKEDSEPEKALNLAIEAHGLAPDLVPAAALAGRMLASRGNTPRATKIIQKTWSRSPHPDLATAYAYARLGDSPRDRFDRVRQLALLNPMSVESGVAAATAAIEAKAFEEARAALEAFIDGRLTQRICLLMARIEGEQHGNKGRVREWLARAVNAPRDPAWTADGVVSDQWAAVSPVTGALDAFQWRVPLANAAMDDNELLQKKLEELVPLGAGLDPALTSRPVEVEAAPVTATATEQRSTEDPPKRAGTSGAGDRGRTVDDAVVVETRTAFPVQPAPAATAPQSEAAEPGPVESGATVAAPPLNTLPTPAAIAMPAAKAGPAALTVAAAASHPPGKSASSAAPAARPVAMNGRAEPSVVMSAPTTAEVNAKASAAYARMSDRSRPIATQAPGSTAGRAEDPVTAAARTVSAAAAAGTNRSARDKDVRPPAASKILLPPRAPDDPGPDAGDVEEARPPIRGYKASS